MDAAHQGSGRDRLRITRVQINFIFALTDEFPSFLSEDAYLLQASSLSLLKYHWALNSWHFNKNYTYVENASAISSRLHSHNWTKKKYKCKISYLWSFTNRLQNLSLRIYL
jgi:hypothetical protein